MRISIIIPVYNAEKYIKRCLDSVLGQSYSDIEVITVDDGSNDDSIRILKGYQQNDNRLKVLSQNHLGPNGARAKALSIATGKFVLFVDADDYIEKKAVEILVNHIKKYHVKSIRFNGEYRSNGKKIFPVLSQDERERLIGHNVIMYLLLSSYSLNSLCLQLYDIEMLRRIKTLKRRIVFGEDFLVNLEVHCRTEKMLLINDVLYHYDDNPNSTTHNKKAERLCGNMSDRIIVSAEAISILDNINLDEEKKNAIYFEQLKMIAERIYELTSIKLNKNILYNELKRALNKDTFRALPKSKMNEIFKYKQVKCKLKYKRLFWAIIEADYAAIWRHIRITRMLYAMRSCRGRDE